MQPIDLSIVITIVSGKKHLDNCLEALSRQSGCEQISMEIIVPYDQNDSSIPVLAASYRNVQFLGMSMPVQGEAGMVHEHFDAYRAEGLGKAKGRIIAMLEDHERPDENWCQAMLAAHRAPHGAIGGAVENDIDRAINWATYFFDFGRYQNPVQTGPTDFLTDVNVSYKYDAINGVRNVWETGFHEPEVHAALLESGKTLWISSDIVVYQHRSGLRLTHSLHERYIWGRYFATKRFDNIGKGRRTIYAALATAVPLIILIKMCGNALLKRRHGHKFIQSLPLIALMALFWSAGEMVGYFTGRPR